MMYRYTGAGYIHGVPARDLTDDEYKAFRRQIAACEKASGIVLYVKEQNKSSSKDEETEQ